MSLRSQTRMRQNAYSFGTVTDNASNMKKSWKLLGEKHSELTCYGCAAHSMNLIFGDLMKLETLKKVNIRPNKLSKNLKASTCWWIY